MSEPLLLISTEFSPKGRTGLVTLRVDGEEVKILPALAREIAARLLDCAEQSETDTLLYDYFTTKAGMNDVVARQTINELKIHRERLRGNQR